MYLSKGKMKTNCIIASWSGQRSASHWDHRYNGDSTYYLKTHFEQLGKLKHNLDQITVVVPFNPNESPDFSDYVLNLDKIGNTKIKVVRSSVKYNYSYGSYYHVAAMYGGEFDYYFLMEDDYVFNMDNFDSILLEKMKYYSKCSYLCGLVIDWNGRNLASVSNGVITSKALIKGLNYIKRSGNWKTRILKQEDFSDSMYFTEAHMKDYSEWFDTLFCYMPDGNVKSAQNNNSKKPSIIVPVNFLKDYDINKGKEENNEIYRLAQTKK